MDNQDPSLSLSVRRKKLNKGPLFKKIGLGIALIFIILFFSRGIIVGAIAGVQFLTIQEITATTTLEGILIKEETVVTAPVTGQLKFISEDGTRLSVGARAAQIAAADQESSIVSVFTPVAGIICRHLDGLENILAPENLELLDLSYQDKLAVKQAVINKQVEKGQPLFKIIDNLALLNIYTEIPKTDLPPELADKHGWLTAAWEGRTMSIKLREVRDKGNRWSGFFVLANYPESLLHHRQVRLTVTTDKLKGLLVPAGAIVYQEGVPGIYLVVKKKAQWVAVTLEGKLNGIVAVSGQGLGEETRYVSNPLFTKEGSRVE
ncbi:MAG: HlyD family efflux transporter periplasmic adaptor subunit [Desulfotomaculaceae bacterium]|nr:HlyD family efflux transporter periplasmic adaptor subunit [Desulfotomaculaceae bacterium]